MSVRPRKEWQRLKTKRTDRSMVPGHLHLSIYIQMRVEKASSVVKKGARKKTRERAAWTQPGHWYSMQLKE